MKKIISICTIFLFTCAIISCKDSKTTQDQTPVAKKDLGELAPDATFNDVFTTFDALEQNPNYNSLFKLINQAQMIEAVKGLHDVTFFAPNNAAFEALVDSDPAWNSIADIDSTFLRSI